MDGFTHRGRLLITRKQLLSTHSWQDTGSWGSDRQFPRGFSLPNLTSGSSCVSIETSHWSLSLHIIYEMFWLGFSDPFPAPQRLEYTHFLRSPHMWSLEKYRRHSLQHQQWKQIQSGLWRVPVIQKILNYCVNTWLNPTMTSFYWLQQQWSNTAPLITSVLQLTLTSSYIFMSPTVLQESGRFLSRLKRSGEIFH